MISKLSPFRTTLKDLTENQRSRGKFIPDHENPDNYKLLPPPNLNPHDILDRADAFYDKYRQPLADFHLTSNRLQRKLSRVPPRPVSCRWDRIR